MIGARLLSFLSCLEYGNNGMTAVIRFALAILHAWIMMHISIKLVFTDVAGESDPVLMIYTSHSLTESIRATEVSPTPLRVTFACERDSPTLIF